MALIEVKDLHKSFGNNHVLRGIDLEVEKGEVVVVIVLQVQVNQLFFVV